MASAVFLFVTLWDGTVAWYEGVLGVVGLAIYVHSTLSTRNRLDEVVEELVGDRAERTAAVEADERAVEPDIGVQTYATIVGSLVVLFVAADQFVDPILSVTASELHTVV